MGNRGRVLMAIVAAGILAYAALGLSPGNLIPSSGGAGIVLEFFGNFISPALDSATILDAIAAAHRTIVFAAAAMSLSLLAGLILGIPASTALWEGDPGRRRFVGPVVCWTTRTVITLMRSVHELLWAVLFLAAFGLNTFAAVIAIAIPYTGTLAKIFSEMIDETARDSAHALRAVGASPLQVFFFGLLPRALPDMAAYAFYRFECAVRSSAILGFFGYQTLGYHIKQSFDNVYYAQVWTHLYALFLIVVLLDAWSGALRRRFVGYE